MSCLLRRIYAFCCCEVFFMFTLQILASLSACAAPLNVCCFCCCLSQPWLVHSEQKPADNGKGCKLVSLMLWSSLPSPLLLLLLLLLLVLIIIIILVTMIAITTDTHKHTQIRHRRRRRPPNNYRNNHNRLTTTQLNHHNTTTSAQRAEPVRLPMSCSISSQL